MADISPQAITAARASLELDPNQMPMSVAIIMDGNGRWGREKHLSRSAGHEAGGQAVRKIVPEAARLGLSSLSLYSFSIENWSRPRDEVNALMHLYAEYLSSERDTIMSHNIQVRHLGRRQGLPDIVLNELDKTMLLTKNNTGMFLCLALNYSSRNEMIDTVTDIARQVKLGKLDPNEINGQLISDTLDTKGTPDPDLVIRTAGEMRLSNFLLWQLSYAEFYCTETYWPDFDEQQFHKALHCYLERNRRYGGVDESNT